MKMLRIEKCSSSLQSVALSVHVHKIDAGVQTGHKWSISIHGIDKFDRKSICGKGKAMVM
jgi:hypothetical protein